ncbi:MAG: hypothetical protein JWO31_1199, partial [Phycisphaerales bacterium]|nr:hypothetical protein [Phycisphaerales bacterium]
LKKVRAVKYRGERKILSDPLLQEAIRRRMAIVKIHSHPGGYDRFSDRDDASDNSFFRAVTDLLEDGMPHASAVMLPEADGFRVFARIMGGDGVIGQTDLVTVAGDDLLMWHSTMAGMPEFVRRHAQAFGAGTVSRLRQMRVAVVGCSGTGSPLISQLVRLGVGKLLLIDMDRVEWKNLNRIYMTHASDANLARLKVDVLAEEIGRVGLGTEVACMARDVATPEVVRAVPGCDVLFGCVDSMSARDVLNRLATYYNLAYFDLGVQLQAAPGGGVDQVTAAVHYLQPGLSSLKSRSVYDSEDVRAELLKRDDPAEYRRRRKEGYIRGVQEDRPAVISVNTLAAALAVNELLARIHPFRNDPNGRFALQQFALHEGFNFIKAERDLPRCPVLAKEVGRGDVTPLLNRPDLAEGPVAA